jgi:hypothetical protein
LIPLLGTAAEKREGWELHWERVRERVDLRAAALAFLAVVVLAAVGLGIGARWIERFYYAMNVAVNHRDVRQDNMRDDRLLQAYLEGQPTPGVNECVLIGSSLTATAHDQDPKLRLQGWVEASLDQLTGQKWHCTNLAADGAVTWTYFYNARLLRLHRPPKVLVVGLDLNYPRDRSLRLLLNVGVSDRDLTPPELSYVAPYNRQLLYVSEANTQRWLRDHLGCFKALSFASLCFPQRSGYMRWLRFLKSQVTGAALPASPTPGTAAAAGAPKSWREDPANKARLEYFKATGGVPQPWDERMPQEYDLLFSELERCQAAGIKVLVVALPRNPAVPHVLEPMQSCITQAAQRHHVAFDNCWLSGKIPEQYYIDAAHFFGKGSEIMGTEIAHQIAAQLALPAVGVKK